MLRRYSAYIAFIFFLGICIPAGAQNDFSSGLDSVKVLLRDLRFGEAKKLLDNLERKPAFKDMKNSLAWNIYYGKYNFNIKNFSAAMENYHAAKEHATALNDSVTLGLIYLYISNLYRSMNSPDSYQEYFSKAIHLSQLMKDTQLLISVAINKGVGFEERGKIDSSLFYYENGRQLAMANEKKYLHELLICEFNIGLLYVDIDKEKAIGLFKNIISKCLAIDRKVTLCNAYSVIAELYDKTGKKDSAFYFAGKSLEVSKVIHDYEVDIKTYGLLARLYQEKGDYRNALTSLRQKDQAGEIITGRMLADKYISLLHIKTIDFKNNEIKLLQKQKESIAAQNKLKFYLWFTIALLIILVLLILVIINRNQKRKLELSRIASDARALKFEQEKITLQQSIKMTEYEARLEGQDAAREHIARELHDQVANSLAGLKLKITRTSDNEEEIQNTDRILEIVDGIYHQIRSISHSLHVPDFEKRPLSAMLNELAHDFKKANGIDISWSASPEERLNELTDNLKKNIFLIIQELLINAAKYSKATTINLVLTRYEDEIILIVEDNGFGFSNDKLPGSRGNGLSNIDWRIKKLKGSIELQTSPYIGTCIHITIPVKNNSHAEYLHH